MAHLFERGFFVRTPAWHRLGVVLDDYPDRETAMRLAGHDWDIIPVPAYAATADGDRIVELERWRALIRSDTGEVIHVVSDTYVPLPNAVAYDVAEALFAEGFQYEAGVTLDGGRMCAITLRLNEPIQIPGDDSIVLPYGCLSWRHDGTGALRCRSGTIRQVCANTVSASEAEGERLGTAITLRHTRNVHERLAQARDAVHGVRHDLAVFRDAMLALAEIRVTPRQRDRFIATIIGDWDGRSYLSRMPTTSERIRRNIEEERERVRALFAGPTIPEAHRLTGYGLFQAGLEYLEHIRRWRSPESYARRSLLHSREKATLRATIQHIAATADEDLATSA